MNNVAVITVGIILMLAMSDMINNLSGMGSGGVDGTAHDKF